MLNRLGFTLMEIIVVMVIMAVSALLVFPNYVIFIEQSGVSNARHNLLAIYSAQKNYLNNNGSYCSATCGSLGAIDTALSLNIQDDGTYTYGCPLGGSPANTCGAARTAPANAVKITVTLNLPVDITGRTNPACVALSSSYTKWCQ